MKNEQGYLTDAELLEKAKRDYPIGTEYYCAVNVEHKNRFTVEALNFSIQHDFDEEEHRFKVFGEKGKGCLYYKGVWAPIVSANLTKEQVYVKLDTTDKVKQFYKLLTDAGEPVGSWGRWSQGLTCKTNTHAQFLDLKNCPSNWLGASEYNVMAESKTEVTIEQLANILNVKTMKYQFKAGDKVRCIAGGRGCGWELGLEFTITHIENYGEAVAFGGKNGDGVYTDSLELVEENQTIIPSRKVSREALAVIYPQVCSGWQSRIDGVLKDADPFSNEVEVPEELVKSAYQEANDKQREWLNLHLPAPKKIETREISVWAVIGADDRLLSNHYTTYSSASDVAKDRQVVELRGSYTLEVEDEEYSYELPF